MKKIIKLSTGLLSVLALTACQEKDTRESHIFTVEVEVTKPSGEVEVLSQDCKQLFSVCQAKFDLNTTAGKRTIFVSANNKPVHEEALYKKSLTLKNKEEEDRLTDSEYLQTVSIKGAGFASSMQKRSFKTIKFQEEKWVPRTERVIQQELMIPDPDLEKKMQDLSKEMKTVFAQRAKSPDEARNRIKKYDSLKDQYHSITLTMVKAADLKIRIY